MHLSFNCYGKCIYPQTIDIIYVDMLMSVDLMQDILINIIQFITDC